MSIDTLAKRQSALLDTFGMITPDGTLNQADRQSMVGQYGGILTPALAAIRHACVVLSLRAGMAVSAALRSGYTIAAELLGCD